MAKLVIPFPFSLSLNFLILVAVLSFIPIFTHSLTLEEDILCLRTLKRSVDPNSVPPSSFLDTWDFTVDPCESSGGKFLGLLCNIPLDGSPSRVTVIDLDGSGYDAFIAPAIANLSELTILNLSKNKFRGPIPSILSKLKKLRRLSLAENYLTGNIPNSVGELKNLEYLDISKNNLTGSIPASIGGLRSLTYLSLSSNNLTSRVPDFSGLWQLRTLDLGSNKLEGNLPNLPVSLRTLLLNHNSLSGHISPLKKLRGIILLDVSDNRLSGSISEDVLTLPKLVRLNVSANYFTTMEMTKFSVPQMILQVLDARRNHLGGHLPLNLVNVQNLTAIYLSYNQLYGPIPKEYGAKLGRQWRIIYFDNNFLTGNPPIEFVTYAPRITGSLADNCLRCPTSMKLCGERQKEASECVAQNTGRG